MNFVNIVYEQNSGWSLPLEKHISTLFHESYPNTLDPHWTPGLAFSLPLCVFVIYCIPKRKECRENWCNEIERNRTLNVGERRIAEQTAYDIWHIHVVALQYVSGGG